MAQLKRDPRSRKKKQEQFLAKLEQLGNVTAACKSSKVPRRTVYNWNETDPVFKVEYEKSVRIAIDMLEDEAKRRAFQGVNEPVYQGGKKVGSVRKFSDTLLIFLLKCLKGDVYKDKMIQEITGKNGEPIKTENTTVMSNVDYSQLPTSVLESIVAARIKVKD